MTIRVTSAAIKVNGEVWSLPRPARHCHLVWAWAEAHQQRLPQHEQGFVLNDGTFVDRGMAAYVAYRAGQIDKEKSILFSEDLW